MRRRPTSSASIGSTGASGRTRRSTPTARWRKPRRPTRRCRRPALGAAPRAAGRAQGQHRHGRAPHHDRCRLSGGPHSGRRRRGNPPAPRRWRGDPRQAGHARARLRRDEPERALRPGPQPVGHRARCRAARAAGPALPSPPDCARPRWAPTPAAPSASLLRSTASARSARRPGGSRSAACSRSPGRWTPSGRWRGRSPIWRRCSRCWRATTLAIRSRSTLPPRPYRDGAWQGHRRAADRRTARLLLRGRRRRHRQAGGGGGRGPRLGRGERRGGRPSRHRRGRRGRDDDDPGRGACDPPSAARRGSGWVRRRRPAPPATGRVGDGRGLRRGIASAPGSGAGGSNARSNRSTSC